MTLTSWLKYEKSNIYINIMLIYINKIDGQTDKYIKTSQ